MKNLECLFCGKTVSVSSEGRIERHDYRKGNLCKGSYWSAYSMSRRMEHVDTVRQLKGKASPYDAGAHGLRSLGKDPLRSPNGRRKR